MINKNFIILLLVTLNFVSISRSDNFCITGSVNSESTSLDCKVTGKIVTDEEKNILKHSCGINEKFFNETNILLLRNGTVHSMNHLNCRVDLKELEFVWLSYKEIGGITENSLNETAELVAKVINDTVTESTICAFNTKNRNCGIDLKDNNLVIITHYNILAQLLPTSLSIMNINFKPWKNVSSSEENIKMGRFVLENYENASSKMFDTIKYTHSEKISINLNDIIPHELSVAKIPGKISIHKETTNLAYDGTAEIHKSKELTFSSLLPSLSKRNATLIGIPTISSIEFSAIVLYDYGNKHYSNRTVKSTMIIKTISDIDIELSDPVPLNYTHAVPATISNSSFNIRIPENIIPIKKETYHSKGINEEHINKHVSHQVYPGFYSWFVAAVIFLGIVALLTFGNMIRIVILEKRLKRQRYRTGSLY